MLVLLVILIGIVVLAVVGWAIVGLALQIIWWALVGLVIGALARLILPGTQTIGWLGTAGAGVAGALLGGIIADALDFGAILQFVLAVLVAGAVIAVAGGTRRRYA